MTTRFDLRLAFLALAWSAAACGGDDESEPTGGPNLTIDGGVRNDGDDPRGRVDGGAAGCFSGKPASNRDFLNACAEGCQPFDNTARLPGYTAGKLPPLQ